MGGVLGGQKSGGTTKQTTTSEPPAYAKPNLEYAAQEARNIYDNPFYQQGWQGQTFVDYSPQTLEALQAQEQRARQGSDLTRAAQAANLATMQGQYLTPESNPFLQQNIDFANQRVTDAFRTAAMPQITGNFSKAGRYGSGFQRGAMSDAQQNLLQQLSQNAVGMAGENFSRERQNQLSATQLAPTLAAQDYIDQQALSDVGSAYEQKQAAQLQDQINKFYQERYAKPQALNDFIAQTMGTAGSYGSQTGVTVAPKQSSSFLGSALGIGSLLAAPFTGGTSLFGFGSRALSSALGNPTGFQYGLGGFGGIPFGGFR